MRPGRYVLAMYEIAVSGQVPDDWSDWFEDFEVTTVGTDSGTITILTGPAPDQAALHGVLARIRDLALPLLWTRRNPTSGRSQGNTPLDT